MTRTQKHTRQPYQLFSKFIVFSFLSLSLFLCSMQNFANASSYPTIEYYELAANQGDMDAQYNLGTMYENGYGAPQDYIKAIYYYELATNQGFYKAQYNLAFMYYNGAGVPQNYSRAYGYILLAIANDFNDENVKSVEAHLLELLLPEQIEEGEFFAEELWKKIETNKN